MPAGLTVSREWEKLLRELSSGRHLRIVYVLGGSDRGKTTFCRYLTEELSHAFVTSYIDCDSGQATIGPPTTIGMSLRAGGRAREETFLRFVGSTTPVGHMLPEIVGTQRLVGKANSFTARRIIMDSSGFVFGPMASEFQFQFIDLIRPDYVIVIRKGNELEHLMRGIERRRGLQVIYFNAASAVKARIPRERSEYRSARFREYFRNAAIQTLSYSGLGMHGRVPDLETSDERELGNRIIAIETSEVFTSALGILKSVDPARQTISFLAPPFNAESAAFIHFGSLCMDGSGECHRCR